MSKINLLFFVVIFLSLNLTAQDEKSKKWDVSNPEGDWNFKEVKLNTDEGTWMTY